MTDDQTDTEALELLRALGRVDPPEPGVLAAARQPLWSAITDELLSADSAGEPGRPQQGEAQQREVQQREVQQREVQQRARSDGAD
ncbi:MAG: hypothetical protein WBH47_20335 [Streptosporangiaceae bacterium]